MSRWALGLILGLAALTMAAPASGQTPSAKPIVGLLDAGERLEWWEAFRHRMRELGYVDGRTVTYEARFAAGHMDRLPTLVEELVRVNVAVLVTSGTVTHAVAKRATSVVPIVMATGDDPVVNGLVKSFARPGGNITGVTSISTGLTGKRFEVLRELSPKLTRLAALWHKGNEASERAMRELEAAAGKAKVALQKLPVNGADDVAAAFAVMKREGTRAVFIISDPVLFGERRRLAQLALEHRIASIHGPAEYVEEGGLLSYAPSYPDLFRRAAGYVDKILKGAKPGELPIEQPTTFEMVINLQTAKTLGVTPPRALLMRANRVID